MKKALILIGGGGHCRSCMDVIEAEGRFAIEGVIDSRENLGGSIDGYPFIGTDEDLVRLVSPERSFLVTVGQIKTAEIRIRLYEALRAAGASIATVISPLAHVSRRAKVGEGGIVMHHALVNAGAILGVNCIVNTKALVEHDAAVGDHCHVSTASVVNGGATLGDRTFLGSGSVVSHGIKVPPGCVIGTGSVLRRDPPVPGVYAGNPPVRLEGVP